MKQNLKAYSWASFVFFYGQFRKPCSDEDDPKDKVRNKLKHYNLMLSYRDPSEWKIIENHHEAIVDKETFDLAQKLTQVKRVVKITLTISIFLPGCYTVPIADFLSL